MIEDLYVDDRDIDLTLFVEEALRLMREQKQS